MLLSPQLGAGPSARATVCVGRGVRVCERGKEASRKVYGRLNLPPWGAEGSGASLGEELCLFLPAKRAGRRFSADRLCVAPRAMPRERVFCRAGGRRRALALGLCQEIHRERSAGRSGLSDRLTGWLRCDVLTM